MPGIELATAYVSIVAETSSLAPSVAKQMHGVEAAAATGGKKAGRALSGGLGLGIKALGTLGAALAVGDFMRDSIAEARESQKVGAITTQVIKTTGGAAKITAAQVSDLAQAISNKTGKDDELIQTGANLLLTFKNVRNEAGAGANIFDRATAAAVDLAAAGFGSVESGSKMLGKALNDPLKGITALSRAGVTFTQQQKDQIKAMVESGDVLGAQKIILKEVESQVGGTAAAAATAGEKMGVAWANMQESVGTALLPALDSIQVTATRVMGWLMVNVPKAFKYVTDFLRPWVGTLTEIFKTGLDIIKAIWDRFGKDILAFLRQTFEFIRAAVEAGLKIARGIINTVLALIKGDWKGVWNGLGQIIRGAWDLVFAAVKWLLQQIGTVLAGGWKIMQGAAKAAFEGIGSAIRSVWSGLTGWLSGPIDRALQFIQENLIDKINGLFAFLHIPLKISPIWRAAARPKSLQNTKGAGGGYGSFDQGGWTGPHAVSQIAGIVHGQEYVIRARSTRELQRDYPGLLEALNGYAGGGYVWPVNARPSFPWGRYPSGRVHRAYDIAARLGTPVRNPYKGRVIADGWDSTGYGVHARIAHDDKRGFSILGHMSREVVKVGQQLLTGQLVGYLGSTGNSTGPHVHWATRWNPYSDATAFDPMKFGISKGAGSPVTELLANIIRSATGGIGSKFGVWGKVFAGVIERLTSGLRKSTLAALGTDSGGLRVQSYDSGGVLRPGWTLAHNGLGRDEYVSRGGGDTYYFRIDARDLEGLRRLEDFIKNARRQARAAGGVEGEGD